MLIIYIIHILPTQLMLGVGTEYIKTRDNLKIKASTIFSGKKITILLF